MSGNDPLPTGTPIGDWGFCDHEGCEGRVPIERDSLLCDEHWEALIRADERERDEPLYTAALMQHMQDRLDLRAQVDGLRSLDYHDALSEMWNSAIDAVLNLMDGKEAT